MSQENKNRTDHNFDPTLFQPLDPVKLFDDYYFIGNKLVGFHVLKTSEGLVLFDAMDKYDVDDEFLIPGLQKLGWDQEPIAMLFLTHGHFDHYMGAEKVRLRTGCGVALSKEDTVFMVNGPDNYLDIEDLRVPRITRLLEDGEDVNFGDHTVHVIGAPGHTPGCLNYSFEVHDGAETHRVIMVGGYGVFGPGVYPGGHDYPFTVTHAVDQALQFASSCVKTWEYCKENGCDVYLNPHPHLCDLLKLAEENQSRKTGEPNAFVIGTEDVRKWVVERFDVCLDCAQQFTDIRAEYKNRE